eukprot:760303-Pyramimonas_sp.AAC.1
MLKGAPGRRRAVNKASALMESNASFHSRATDIAPPSFPVRASSRWRRTARRPFVAPRRRRTRH